MADAEPTIRYTERAGTPVLEIGGTWTVFSIRGIKSTLEKVLKGYQRHRRDGESFQAFTQRHDLNSLQAIFSNDE